MSAVLDITASREPPSPDDAAAPAVVLRGVDMAYGAVGVLQKVDLALGENEFLSVVGPSGCGKSTTLKLISGLARPTAGEVLVRGISVRSTPPGIGFMFQRDALLPWATVDENIGLGLECRSVPRRERAERVAELLEVLGLTGFGRHYPHALSGGMRQRVALGRILAYEPDIYLMDEPFGALDAQTKLLMGRELLRIWSSRRKGVIFVTHDIEEAVSLSDRVVVMTGRPGRMKSEYRIPFARPRDPRAVRRLPEFHALVDAIWEDIMGESLAARAAG
jgi:NitT/TauT family transport system ATP-binding protein